MSDTHAHTAKVQADVQTGRPHMPPGHVEAKRPVRHLSDRQIGALAPWLWVGAILVAIIVAALVLTG
jgi:hypothetical protein